MSLDAALTRAVARAVAPLAARIDQLEAELARRDVPTTPTVDPVFLTLDQAATALAVSRRTVERLAASGRLETVRDGGRRRVHPDALTRYANSLTEGGVAA